MPSSINDQMTPYVILNDHSEQPSVSYSNGQSNGIQTLTDTSIRNPHIIIRTFHRFTRAIQVRLSIRFIYFDSISYLHSVFVNGYNEISNRIRFSRE